MIILTPTTFVLENRKASSYIQRGAFCETAVFTPCHSIIYFSVAFDFCEAMECVSYSNKHT